jgi:hypothetical protein
MVLHDSNKLTLHLLRCDVLMEVRHELPVLAQTATISGLAPPSAIPRLMGAHEISR